MKNEIIIGVGIIITALLYFAGVKRTQMQGEEKDKKEKLDKVFDTYMDYRRRNYTAGYDGLINLGVATLEDDAEIRKLCKKIEQHGERHPLGQNKHIFDGIDLKKFFCYVVDEKVNVFKTPIEDIIDKFKKVGFKN